MKCFTALSDVLSQINELPWSEALYLPAHSRWSLNTRCVVANPDNLGEVIVHNGQQFRYALNIQQIKDIYLNASAQQPNLDLEKFFQAFIYYYQHDAFLTFF